MKYQLLVQRLTEKGFQLIRQGGNHEIYSNGKITIPVPRHKDINELLAKALLKQAGK